MKDTRSIDIMKELVAVSGSEVFSLKDSPQYKAACWVLYEDPMRTNASDKSPNLIQRYVGNDGVECSKHEI
eukprot:7858732-Ditylum_brightwellii.AAC.1